MAHVCEPARWPKTLDETWTCPECGCRHVAFNPLTDEGAPTWMRRHAIAGTLGWRAE